jgi:hypothetical protein
LCRYQAVGGELRARSVLSNGTGITGKIRGSELYF